VASNGTVKLEGLDGLLDRMRALPREVVSKNGGPARAALFRGARVIRDAARAKAPVRSGFLQKQIAALRSRDPKRFGASEMYSVGIKGGARKKYANTKRNVRKGRAGQEYETAGNAYYWRFMEFGTARMPARPFLRPAFEANKEKAMQTIVDELNKGLDRIVRKLAKGKR
jgi:HK97 gp10 family phage protein